MKRAACYLITVLCLCVVQNAYAKKVKTGVDTDNLYADSRYGVTFEKNDSWKFKIKKEKEDKPEMIRTVLNKLVYKIPDERKFSPENWTAPYGGLLIDTTSLSLEQFKGILINTESKNKQRRAIAKIAEILNRGEFIGERRLQVGNLGLGCALTFKEEYKVQTRDFRDNYNVISDHVMGELYLTIQDNKFYVLFFTAERTEYRLAKEEIEKMLTTLKFPVPATAPDSAQVDTTAAAEHTK